MIEEFSPLANTPWNKLALPIDQCEDLVATMLVGGTLPILNSNLIQPNEYRRLRPLPCDPIRATRAEFGNNI